MIGDGRYTRRLLFMLLWVVILDFAARPILERVEKRRYESRTAFRFENSDFFGLGPMVAYLREHPRGERRRVAFFGNSMVFGYALPAGQSLPAMYERLRPETRVFNLAINGQETGSSHLIGKAILESVDTMFVQIIGKSANPILPSLIPVEPEDAKAYGIPMPNIAEAKMQAGLGRVWRMYGANHRLQAAVFGTSTRQYLYLHKREIVQALLRRQPAPSSEVPPAPAPIALRVPMGRPAPRAELMLQHPHAVLALADFARAKHRRVIFMLFEYGNIRANDSHVAAFNATYAPDAHIVVIRVPPELTQDGQHFTWPGAMSVAKALADHAAEADAR